MREYDVELAVGEALVLGNRILTILDIQGDEFTFRIDHLDELENDPLLATGQASRLPPR